MAHRLLREFKAFSTSNPPPHGIAIAQDPSTALKWHFVLYDFDENSPYHGGTYHGLLTYPKEYPFKPPNIKLITPSGRFTPSSSLCFSMSDFHPESWNPSWTLETILVGFYSFMEDQADPLTTGSISTTREVRKQLAMESKEYNRRSEVFRTLFPQFC